LILSIFLGFWITCSVIAEEEVSEKDALEYDNLYAQASGIPGPGPGEDFQGKKERLPPRLMVMWSLVDYLNLNEETSAKFFPAYLEYINNRDKLLKEQRELIHTISENVDNESIPIKNLKKDVEKLTQIGKSLNEDRNKFLGKAEKILDERQNIKLIVFEDKLKYDLFDRFRSMRTPQDREKGKE
ncbi:MAG TPA: hypothetical protein VMZ04_07320, partial [Anaerolineae bacterium]|nr:hypothetical protein [Anaerolineae bacterium]